MAETSVTNQTCPTCGVEVRPNTQFCYNCGGAVSPDAIAALKEEKGAVKPLPLEKTVEESNGAAVKPTNKLDLADLAAKPIEKPKVKEESELKSRRDDAPQIENRSAETSRSYLGRTRKCAEFVVYSRGSCPDIVRRRRFLSGSLFEIKLWKHSEWSNVWVWWR